MQIFEFHFNPKLKEDKTFDSFVYEPESTYEKKLGNLYIVGELQNSTSSSSLLLDNITKVFKKNYYSLSIKSQEKALSYASKRANEFLSEEVKKENVAWLGNLNFAIVSLDNFNLTFTKTGDLKILLLRGGQIIDIGKNLEIQEIDPYPLKIFFNVVSGKLVEDDRLLILTKEIFDLFQEENILTKFAQSKEIDSKSIKKIIPPTNVSGICFLTALTSKQEKRTRGPVLFQNNTKKSILSKFLSFIPKIPKPRIPKAPKLPKLPKIKIPVKTNNQIVEKFKNKINKKNKIIPIIGLILVLLIGFYLFKRTPEKESSNVPKDFIERSSREPDKLEVVENPETITPDSGLFSSPTLPKNLNPPSDTFASYLSNLYFLDKENCEVIKYSYLGGNSWGSAEKWLKEKTDCYNPKSITVDGSVYILNSNNSISVYHSGLYQKTIKTDIYPEIKDITFIKTKKNTPYIFLLEPTNNRVIIISKEDGEIIKQIQSPKFDNLVDLDISPTGQTIYLLNNSTIYKLSL